jgi:membrane-bound serine protease (ClpP class)
MRGRQYSSGGSLRTEAAVTSAANRIAHERGVARTTAAPWAWLTSLTLLGLVVIAGVSAIRANAAQPATSTVILAHLEGSVDPVTAEYVHRVVAAASERQASLLVLTIDTPGGLDASMRQMVQDLLNSPVPSVAYVWPSGARAASAGVFVGEAANLVAMAPGTNIGAAHPIQGGGESIPGDLRDKITNDAAAYIAGIARQRGRNDAWVQDAVRLSVSLDADQAVEQHVADLLEPNLSLLLRDIDGRTVTTAAGPRTIQIANALVSPLEMEPLERIAQKTFDPNIAYLLMTIGFFAILIELFHPGALVPGVSGVVCLVLAFVGFATLPMNWGGVVLILTAAALFVLDVKAAAHGGLSIAGLVCFVFGSMLLYSPPGPPSPTLPEVSVATPVLIAAAAIGALFSILVVRTAIRMSGRAPITGSQRLSGATGVSSTSLDPEGTVRVGGQAWSAHLRDGRMEPGQRVRVVGRKGLILEVEPISGLSSSERKEVT